MIWIDAIRNIAVMAKDSSFRNWSVRQRPRQAMRVHFLELSRAHEKTPVALFIKHSSVEPATLGLYHFAPQANVKRDNSRSVVATSGAEPLWLTLLESKDSSTSLAGVLWHGHILFQTVTP